MVFTALPAFLPGLSAVTGTGGRSGRSGVDRLPGSGHLGARVARWRTARRLKPGRERGAAWHCHTEPTGDKRGESRGIAVGGQKYLRRGLE